MSTKRIPVNAPSAASARTAVINELARQGIEYTGEPVVFPAPRHLFDHEVAIVVTAPIGRRTTLIVQVDVTK